MSTKSGEDHIVSYASHMDSHIYSYYAHKLTKKYEKLLLDNGISNNILAFRKLKKSNIDFANTAFNVIRARGACAVLALDISGFFDNLNHDILKKAWCKVLDEDKLPNDDYKVFKSLTKYSYVYRDALYKALNISKHNPRNGRRRVCEPKHFRSHVRDAKLINTNINTFGIPQGSPISALLSNIYMLDFDINMHSLMKANNSIYYRYCDDILCITPFTRSEYIETYLMKELAFLNLKINTEKTKRHAFSISNGLLKSDSPLQYLGFIFDGQNKLIRSAALARFSERMKAGVKLAKYTKKKHDKFRSIRGQKPKPLYKKKLYERYSHLGHRNFIRYGFRCANTMNSKSIKKQLKPLWKRLQKEIEK